MNPLSAFAGEEFGDANNATFDNSVVNLDNSVAGETNFTIDVDRTTIDWQDFQQPASNTLDFHFSNANDTSSVLNRIGSQSASNVFGSITSNGQVILANPFGVFIREGAILDVGSLVAVGANISRDDYMNSTIMSVPLTGDVQNDGMILAEGNIALLGRNVTNNGTIRSGNGSVLAIAAQHLTITDWDALTADFLAKKNFFGFLADSRVVNTGTISAQNAAFFGGQITNMGDIEIQDGTLLMIAADAVWVTQFDNPVLIKVPNQSLPTSQTNDSANGEVEYAIENHGRLDAGLGHVRLAASDPLGYAIRQGTGTVASPAVIVAQQISLEGGESGRVHLSGEVDASDLSENGVGGEIDITGSMVVLEGANIHASGTTGGGTIHVGGEREGRGELQRARLAIVDADSEIHADAIQTGDGGEVIVFAEDLTLVDGEITARGGAEGGNGGFVETSGLRNFLISRAPNVTAPTGHAGEWLIDPFNITIDDTLPTDNTNLNNSINAILSPSFDPAGFDGILRTVRESSMDANGNVANLVSADLIADALATGTSVTLSTQAFGIDRGTALGDINILSDILVDSLDTIEGTTATLRLLAAGDINVESDIMAFLTLGAPTNLTLNVELHANDAGQVETDQRFDASVLQGDVLINADIRTGGGSVTISGSSVIQALGQVIDTDGGAVDIRSGTVNRFGTSIAVERRSTDPALDPIATPDPRIEIAGDIDTCVTALCLGSETGGDVTLVASSINVRTSQGGPDPEQIVSGLLLVTGQIQTGGGDIALSGGVQSSFSDSSFTGNVDIDGDINSGGGNVTIVANHKDPNLDSSTVDVSFLKDPLEAGGFVEGGFVDIDANISTAGGALSIGNELTRSISLDGAFDTTRVLDSTENGLVQLVAQDLGGVDTVDGIYGQSEIILGATSDTSISTSALVIESRVVQFSEGTGANAVTLVASGSSSATLPELSLGAETTTATTLTRGSIRIAGERQITFNQNTSVTAESIEIVAAARPAELNISGASGDERINSETRLVFGGAGGSDATVGVRLNADSIQISVGDGTTPGSDGFLEDLGTSAAPTEFGLQRLTRASYDGLQLRDTTGLERPADLQISQDGDLTLLSSAPTAPAGELDLVGSFDAANIGAEGIHLTLESSDGLLIVEDALGLNNAAGVLPGSDAGKSFVVLNGGLVLTTSPNEPTFMDDSVRFRDGTAILGAGGTTAFNVESLIVSSAGNFTVRQQIIDSIDPVSLPNELIFEAGRNTGASDSAGRGTLTIDPGLTIQSGDRLALLAGGSGFGNLVFAGAGTTLAADDIALRAGAGVDSQNLITGDRASITGLQANDVMIRDARFAALGNAAIFGEVASSATSFSYRQDAAIDAQTDLPELTQFGLPATGFRTAGDVAYKVRSDEGNIDLDDEVAGTNEGNRFQNTNLSLIGVDSTFTPAVDVSSDFTFVGNRVELGGIGDFTFTQTLAAAFNRSGTNAEEEITLRAGAGGLGNLDFNRGTQSSVVVRAPRINLIAGDGLQVDDTGLLLGQSTIDTRNAQFDLGGPVGSTPTFAFNTAAFLSVSDLPDADQFMTDDGMGGLVQLLPDILALRTEIGELDFEGFDITLLPLDIVDDPGRLILEAELIRLAQTGGASLDLTSVFPNLKLRFRTNGLTLIAANAEVELAFDAEVMIGSQLGDNLQPGLAMPNSSFDNESLLIEAFDVDARIPTVDNLSSMSEDTPGSDLFTLANARGPNSIGLAQDAAVTPSNLFNRDAVAGQLAQSITDDVDGNAIATIYSLTSFANQVTFNPENVNGSNLIVTGAATDASVSVINFGVFGTPGVFFFDNVLASTESSILIQDGTEITASESITLAAGQIVLEVDDPGTVFGSIEFEEGMLTTRLTANRISITAGPSFKLEGPADANGDPMQIDDSLLPRVDLRGLDEIVQTGAPADSSFSLTQSANLSFLRGSESDFLTPIEAGMGANRWGGLTLSVTQGDLTLNEIDSIAAVAESLFARTVDLESQIDVTVRDGTDPMVPVAPFDAFVGSAEFQSNDILFQSTNANTSIDLDTDKLLLVSTSTVPILAPADERARLRDDPDVDNRPIVRIQQVVDFTDSELPQPSQYFVLDALGLRTTRSDLSGLDIELTTTDTNGTLTLDDDIRARVTTANLILDSAGDIDISLTGPTPGFSGFDYADLQLGSLDLTAVGNITIRPFTSGGNPVDLTIETVGDQRFTGTVLLENTLSTRGRDIRFTENVEQISAPTAGLLVASSGKVVFERNIGTVANPLDRLTLTFDSDTNEGTPNVEFEFDANNQRVDVENDIIFLAYDFDDGDRTAEIEAALGTATTLPQLDAALAGLDLGRTRSAIVATIGKNSGNLTFTSANGNFVMGEGEKLSVGGNAIVDVQGGLVALGDLSAISLTVTASAVGLVRRGSGSALTRSGEVRPDGGASIIANTIAFMDTAAMALTPVQIGSGRSFRFGVPNPFDPTTFPASLDQFPLFEINANGSSLAVEDFRFLATSGDLANQVPILGPRGASRSDLSGAFGPEIEPTPIRPLPDLVESPDPDRLMGLDIDALDTPIEIRLARLEGVAIINDLGRASDEDFASVTTARIDAEDAESAITLYEELFGKQGNRAGAIRSVLQDALDRYLENSRARRVVGFELRRFVKNRPSTLFEAYTTLESLDALFQYHRRLGLSPGEYRGIQKNWLRRIQPDGITLDELSEAIHPSRYVRGSDILDIFGR